VRDGQAGLMYVSEPGPVPDQKGARPGVPAYQGPKESMQ
jgi:hypothetical protein